jgi:hypothetical protein
LEVLETAQVDVYRQNDVIIPCTRRQEFLCVVWEGTCSEKLCSNCQDDSNTQATTPFLSVWYAGDWSGPLSLQPDRELSGESTNATTHDMIAVSHEGVKVITIEFSKMHAILMNGSSLYRRYLERLPMLQRALSIDISPQDDFDDSINPKSSKVERALNVLELIDCNSALRKLSAVLKRHLESLAEGPVMFAPNERMWQAGVPVNKAYLIVSGTASFHVRRNAGSFRGSSGATHDSDDHNSASSELGNSMRMDAIKIMKELERCARSNADDCSDVSSLDEDNKQFPLELFGPISTNGNSQTLAAEGKDCNNISKGLASRANQLVTREEISRDGSMEFESGMTPPSEDVYDAADPISRRSSHSRRVSRSRFTNKVLGRLYNRRTLTSGLVFSRGHFLGDVSKMVAGLLVSDENIDGESDDVMANDVSPYVSRGVADTDDDLSRTRGALADLTIHEQDSSRILLHTSTLTAGKEGCIALVFPKSSLIPLLDSHPGFLLSLLGTQVLV